MEMHYEDGAGTSLSYKIVNEQAVITGCAHRAAIAIIPEYLEKTPVTAIAKKAFLGCKQLRFLRVPARTVEIGEWAFAFCDRLSEIELPANEITFGQGCFQKDNMLKEIFVYHPLSAGEDIGRAGADCTDIDRTDAERQTARLLAACVQILEAEYLLEPLAAGSEAWLAKWDLKMRAFLALPDEEGYQKLVLCGEEDLSANLEDYLSGRRQRKADICFLRLLNPMGLSETDRELLTSYLKQHRKGCESEAAWEVVLNEHGDDREYYHMLLKLDCVRTDNFEAMLADMGDRHAEMKAYLINEREKDKPQNAFYEALSLDL